MVESMMNYHVINNIQKIKNGEDKYDINTNIERNEQSDKNDVLLSKDVLFYLEQKQKIHRNSLISRKNKDSRVWARDAAQSAISEVVKD